MRRNRRLPARVQPCFTKLSFGSALRQQHRCRAIEFDFSDPDTQVSVAGIVLGLVFGLGAPAWYINRLDRDEERLEEIRALNRATFKETGEYLSEVCSSGFTAHARYCCMVLTWNIALSG